MRAMQRIAAVTRARLRRRVDSLATIAVIAPFMGVVITLSGIIGSFPGYNGDKLTHFALVTCLLSFAIVRCALGLLVGILSYSIYHFLLRQLDELALEMRSATLELANVLCMIPLRK